MVHALVARADEDELLGAGQVMRDCLLKRHSTGIEQDPGRRRQRYRVQRGGDRLGTHDHPGATAVRVVIHAAVAPKAPLAKIMRVQLSETALDGPTRDACAKRTREKLGKDRDDIDAQRHGRISFSAGFVSPSASASTTMRFSAGLSSLTTSPTAGMRISPRSPRTSYTSLSPTRNT